VTPETILPGALKTEDEHRRDICAIGRMMHERGYVAACDGNISVRLDSRHILTTPTGMCKGMLAPEDLVITDLDGKKIVGRRHPSSELAMHLRVYARRPEINAVCHAHPITATGYAAAGLALDKALLCELVISLGSVPVAPYGMPGTSELADTIDPLVEGYDAILLANHGVVTYGPDLITSFFRMETTEHFARVALVTEMLGKQVLLSGGDVQRLFAARARYGLQSPSAAQPGAPLTSDNADTERITLTRRELESLIDEAIKKDRAIH
jgi:L-fuculose-phosphate aldolase